VTPRTTRRCDGCKVYKREERNDGTTEVRCEYKIHALHMKFTYYMLHYVDKDNGCVVWNLDYNRDSDLDDSVGYWCAGSSLGECTCGRRPQSALLARH
jgi:hypothetical protein